MLAFVRMDGFHFMLRHNRKAFWQNNRITERQKHTKKQELRADERLQAPKKDLPADGRSQTSQQGRFSGLRRFFFTGPPVRLLLLVLFVLLFVVSWLPWLSRQPWLPEGIARGLAVFRTEAEAEELLLDEAYEFGMEDSEEVPNEEEIEDATEGLNWEDLIWEDSESYDNDGLIEETGTGGEVVNYAEQFIGNPYVWGGTSLTEGCDCSGFTMSVYAHFGISLPHEAEMQSAYGKVVALSDLRAGDLVFYGTPEHITHVAIYAGGGLIVHAGGRAYGICKSRLDYYTHVAYRRLL